MEEKIFCTVYLKNSETAQVELDDLKDYLEKNREIIQYQQQKMGKRRTDTPTTVSSR